MTDKVVRFPTGLASMEDTPTDDHADWLRKLAADVDEDSIDAIIVLVMDKGGKLHTALSRVMRHDQLIGVLSLAQYASIERMHEND